MVLAAFLLHLLPFVLSQMQLQVQNTYRNIIQLALPVAIAIVIPQLSMLTNTLFLSNYHPVSGAFGTQDLLSATGIAGIYYLTLAMICYGLSAGVLMLLSRSAGSNQAKQIGTIFSNGLILCLLVSLSLVLISWFLGPYIFEHTLTDPAVRRAASEFISIRLWGLPFISLCQLANSFFLSTSHSRLIIAGSLAQTLTNILFDYLLIFGHMGFPEMGLNGTAVASVISEIVYLDVAHGILMSSAKFKQYGLRYFTQVDWLLIRETFYKSSPLIVQYLLSIGAWEVFFIFVEHLGKTESAASQILRTVFGVVGIAAFALGSTTNSMVSNLIGQQREELVIPLIRKIIRLSFGVAFVLGSCMLCFPRAFLQLLSNDPQIVSTGLMPLRIVVIATWTLSVSTVFFNAVLGTGQTRTNMYFELIAITLYLLYCFVIIEYWRLPLAFAWASEFIYWLSLLAMSSWYIYSGHWKHALRSDAENQAVGGIQN